MLLPVVDWKELFAKQGLKVTLIGLGALLCLTGVGFAAYYLWPEPAPAPPPPVQTATVQQSAAYAASDDFNRLPMNQRLEWVEGQMDKMSKMDDDEFVKSWRDLDAQTRDRIRDNMREVMKARTDQHVREYDALPPDKRTAFLDERLDEMKSWDSKFHKVFGRPRMGPGGPRSQGGYGGGDSGGAGGGGDQQGQSGQAQAGQAQGSGMHGPRGAGGDFHRSERQAMRQRFRNEAGRFMVKESPDKRAKTVQYFQAIAKRQAQRGEGGMFRGGR